MLYDLIRQHDRFLLLDVHGRLLTEHPCLAQVGWWVMNKIIHLPSLTNKSPNSARTSCYTSGFLHALVLLSSDSRVSESPLSSVPRDYPFQLMVIMALSGLFTQGLSRKTPPQFLTTSDLSVTHHFLGLLYKDCVLLLINYVPHLNISY